MNINIRHIAALALWVMVSASANAQDLNTGYLSSTYLYGHDLNPANDNDKNYVSVPFLGNLDIKMMGNFGYKDVVMKNPLYPDLSSKKMTTFMNPYIKSPLKGFSTGDNIIRGQVKAALVSVGFKGLGGYNTVELNARGQANGRLPYELLRFACDIGNESYDIGSLKADAIGYTELSLGHSRDINDKLRIGAKLKLLMGLGSASVRMDNVRADLNGTDKWTITADAESHVSMNGFRYETGTKSYNATDREYTYVRDIDSGDVGICGYGLAADLGVTYKISDDLTLSAAVLDLGAISWKNDYTARNTSGAFSFDGFHDVSMDKESHDNLEWQTDRYTDQMLDFAHLSDQGDQGSRTTGLGATLNIGVSYALPSYKALTLGFLGTQYINGDYSCTEGRAIANIKPTKWFEGAASLSVSNYGASFGWLASVSLKNFGVYIGMDQLLTECSKELVPLNSNASISMGLNITW